VIQKFKSLLEELEKKVEDDFEYGEEDGEGREPANIFLSLV
jgi:hypothetical protein